MYKPFVTNIASVETTGPDTLTDQAEAARCRFPGQLAVQAQPGAEACLGADLRGPEEQAADRRKHPGGASGQLRPVPHRPRQPEPGDRARGQSRSLEPSQDQSLDHAHHAQRRGIGGCAEERRDQLPRRLHRRSGAAAATSPSRSPTSKSREALDIGFKFIAYNERRPPFDNLAFRQAISAVIDRRAAGRGCLGRRGRARQFVDLAGARRLARQGHRGSRARTATSAAAQKILKDAGFVLVGNVLHYPKGVKETTAPFQ